jgi:predicted nuclease with TOPRIM domain
MKQRNHLAHLMITGRRLDEEHAAIEKLLRQFKELHNLNDAIEQANTSLKARQEEDELLKTQLNKNMDEMQELKENWDALMTDIAAEKHHLEEIKKEVFIFGQK